MGIDTNKRDTGFTIIETMLFLAVTGILAAAILFGSGVTIGQQRYRDSVNSLKSFIQQQYNSSSNVINSRDTTWACNQLAAVVQPGPANGEARGRSDCVILGRYVTVDNSGTNLSASNVVGYRQAGAPLATSDIAELSTNYRLGISPIDQESSLVSWGARVIEPKTANTPLPLTLLIIRSPLSGAIMTFSSDGVVTNPNTLISAGNLSQQRNLCVNADIGTFVGQRLAVRIDAYASSQSAVQIPTESDNVCD